MVDGEHHGAARSRVEHPRHAVFHAPVELMRALQIEAGRLLRSIEGVAFAFLVGFRHCRQSLPVIAVVSVAESGAAAPAGDNRG